MMMSKHPLGVSEAMLGEAEADAVAQVIRSGWISQGEMVRRFENAFAVAHENRHAVAVCNATAGLHLALHALGIGSGDVVLVPGLTFVGAVNAVIYAGATPQPVDIISQERPHICLEAAAAAVTPRTRAIMVMHHAGYAVNMPAWESFARERGLLLIEDAAHAPGFRMAGSHSHAAVFSFFANKNMTTAEGGIILVRDEELAQRLRRLRGHAMSAPTLTRAQGHAFSYDVDELGFNYRMDDMRAALGLVQLKNLAAYNERRRELSSLYRLLLAEELPKVRPVFTAEHETTAHLFPVLLPPDTDRTALMARLRDEGIQTSVHYPPYHFFKWHKAVLPPCALPHTEAYCAATLSLPLHPGLTEEDIRRVVRSICRGME